MQRIWRSSFRLNANEGWTNAELMVPPDLLVSDISPDRLLLSAAVRKIDEVHGVWVVLLLEALNRTTIEIHCSSAVSHNRLQ